MKIFIGMETSGALRQRLSQLGHIVISCDTLPAEDGAGLPATPESTGHIQGDVFEVLAWLKTANWWPDRAVFHPTCTYLTNSAAWAYTDGPYHQRVKAGTLVGASRRAAREIAIAEVKRIALLPIAGIIIENPVGVLSTRYRKPDQIVQPYMLGDDASKATCIWIEGGAGRLPILDKLHWVEPRWVDGKPRWANQTDSGQNRLSPGEDRWKERSRTYPGIADALVQAITGKSA